MPAAYDQYNYPDYWKQRSYEHESEVIAIKSFLHRIPSVESVIDIGAGFGRHTPNYAYRAKKIILADPSARILKEARERLVNYTNIKFVQSKLENLSERLKNKKFDLIFFIRVIHHIEDPDLTIEYIDKLTEPGGYLIMEFANKVHWKQVARNFMKGNFTYPIDINPSDRRSEESIESKTIPFLNFHPDVIFESLRSKRYRIIEVRSVSNVRSSFLKRILPHPILMYLESFLQKPLAFFKFGPSIFILARKAKSTG